MEEIEQKLEEIRTKALEPLKLLGPTKAILFTRSTLSPRKGALSVEQITGTSPRRKAFSYLKKNVRIMTGFS